MQKYVVTTNHSKSYALHSFRTKQAPLISNNIFLALHTIVNKSGCQKRVVKNIRHTNKKIKLRMTTNNKLQHKTYKTPHF